MISKEKQKLIQKAFASTEGTKILEFLIERREQLAADCSNSVPSEIGESNRLWKNSGRLKEISCIIKYGDKTTI